VKLSSSDFQAGSGAYTALALACIVVVLRGEKDGKRQTTTKQATLALDPI